MTRRAIPPADWCSMGKNIYKQEVIILNMICALIEMILQICKVNTWDKFHNIQIKSCKAISFTRECGQMDAVTMKAKTVSIHPKGEIFINSQRWCQDRTLNVFIHLSTMYYTSFFQLLVIRPTPNIEEKEKIVVENGTTL